jgi:hypothetical protein
VPRIRIYAAWILPVLTTILLAACISQKETTRPDDRYGHRFGSDTAEGRLTVLLEPPAEDMAEFVVTEASFDTVHIRPASPEKPDDPVLVEVLVKGAFPDGCTSLHALKQTKDGSRITAQLDMRRRTSDVCTQAVRPYRFYFNLDELYTAGEYALMLNQREFFFRVEL